MLPRGLRLYAAMALLARLTGNMLLMLQTTWPYYNRTAAHISYAYDVYTGTKDTYLQMQQLTYYKSTTGSNK